MLARMAKADAQAVKPADFVIERANMFQLFSKRRRGLGHSGFEPPAKLARQPGLALRAAADHDRIGAGFFQRRDRFLERCDVAIYDQRNRNGILDRAHRVPIRFALVELAAGAAMYGDHLHAGRFRTARQFRRIDRAIVPAEPHF